MVAKLLRYWAEGPRPPDDEAPEKLVYLLDHAYTPAELGFNTLKGADSGVARVVLTAAERSGCDVHLALVKVEESGSAEYTGYNRGRRHWDDDEDNDDDEPDGFEVCEIIERSVIASQWRRPDGEPSPLTEIPIEDEEFSSPEAFEELEPDEEHFHEATGNEGASFERSYLRAALILWPRERLYAVIGQGGLPVALAYLAHLAERWVATGESSDSSSWEQAHEFASLTVEDWPMSPWYPRRDNERTEVGQMLELLARLADVSNLEPFLTAIADRGGFDPGDAAPIASAIRLLPPDQAASLAARIVSGAAEFALSACAALLAHGAVLDPAVVLDAARALVDALPRNLDPGRWRRGPDMNTGFVVDLFTALTCIDAALADRAATHVLAWRATYDFDTILIPAAKQLLGPAATQDSTAVRQIQLACAGHLDGRVAQPLAPPRDWGRPNALSCACRYCAELGRFLADPVNRRWVLKANETDRGHVEGTIRNARCDVDTMTERRGRPYSLICTKNQASYERRLIQRRNDLADLEWLRA
jgi:hypothetical protein